MQKPFFTPALKISLIYLLISVLWLVISNNLLLHFIGSDAKDYPYLFRMEMLKGLIFVIASAAGLYLLIQLFHNKISRSAKEYQNLFIENPNPMWIYDKKTYRFLSVNNAAVALYGYSQKEFLKMSIFDIRPMEDVEHLEHHLRGLKEGFNDAGIWKHYCKAGRLMYVHVLTHTINYQGRNVELATIHDVTGQELSKVALSLNEKKLQTLINTTTDAIWSIDTDLRITAMNSAFEQILPDFINPVSKIGDSIIPEGNGKETLTWKNQYLKALSGKRFSQEEAIYSEKSGNLIVETTFNPIFDDMQCVIGVVCFAHNITERHNYISQIEKQNQLLKDIAWISSHEVRRPVASILGLAQMFKGHQLSDEENSKLIRYIGMAATELDHVIHKIAAKAGEIYFNKQA